MRKIYLCVPHLSGKEIDYVKEAFDSNWVAPLGPNVDGFEGDLKRYLASSQDDSSFEVVALCSGTAALHLGMLCCGVGPGDEVITQSFTFCASANPIIYLGATPVFVDSEKASWNMDPDLMEEAIKDRIAKTGKTPKAIVPVSLFGMPYQIDRIMEVADRYGIPVVEDAAEGLGSCFNGRCLGTFGRFGALSFNGNKMITTSGGGALICSNPEEKSKVLWYATQARDSYPYYQHEAIGYNYRLSNVSAGIGRGQMFVLDEHIAHHRMVKDMYKELFRDIPGIEVHDNPSPRHDSNFWLNTITIDPSVRIQGQDKVYQTIVPGAIGGAPGTLREVVNPRTGCEPNDNVEALRLYLAEAGIESRPLWKPMHKQPVFSGAPAYVNGVSEGIFKIGMCLPSGPLLTREDVCRIVETVKEAII